MNVSDLIPTIDTTYVQWGNFKQLETVITSRKFIPTYIWGETSLGKTSSVEQIHAKHKLPIIRQNLNQMVDEDALIGRYTLINGNVEVIEGAVILAMRLGCTLLLDEISAAHPNAILCLQGILEGKPYYFKLKNEIVTPSPGFNIIATDNTRGQGSHDGKYVRNILDDAFLERFALTFHHSTPTERVINSIIKTKMAAFDIEDEKIASYLTRLFMVVNMTYQQGGIPVTLSIRRVSHIINALSIFKKIDVALNLCLERFDDESKSSILSLWNAIVEP